MMCPYCGKEMKKGFIQSPRGIFWSPRKKKLFFTPSETGDVPIANAGWNGSFAEASFCDDCKKIVIDC